MQTKCSTHAEVPDSFLYVCSHRRHPAWLPSPSDAKIYIRSCMASIMKTRTSFFCSIPMCVLTTDFVTLAFTEREKRIFVTGRSRCSIKTRSPCEYTKCEINTLTRYCFIAQNSTHINFKIFRGTTLIHTAGAPVCRNGRVFVVGLTLCKDTVQTLGTHA